jgi:DNA-binding NarL/FixJ family response regulator
MDISLPGQSGIDATTAIKRAQPEVQIVGLSMYDNEEYVTRLLRAGASGYVLKRSAATDLVAAVRAAHAGEAFLYPSIARRVIDDYLRRLDSQPTSAGLTAREREILALIAEGLTNGAIAKRLYISVNTVRNHVQSILSKLDVHSRAQAVFLALRDPASTGQ